MADESGPVGILTQLVVPEIEEYLDSGRDALAREAMIELLDPEVVDLLRDLPPEHQLRAFELLPAERAASALSLLSPDQQQAMVQTVDRSFLVQALNAMPPDDRAAMFDRLPDDLRQTLVELLSPVERRATDLILSYPQGTVGRLMTTEFLTLRPEWTVQQAIDHLRRVGRDAETMESLFVVDGQQRLLDVLRMRHIVLAAPSVTIDSLMDGVFVAVHDTDDQESAAVVLDRYDRPTLAVLDANQRLVGIVTFDDLADVVKQAATEDMQKLGGMEALDQPYMSVSVGYLFRKRGLWLSILFLGEMLTATAMQFFEEEIKHAAVLALFLPLIISSGGNSGSQASTLVIRAMALREVGLGDWWKVMRRELMCGLLLGLLLGFIGLVRIHLWEWLGFYDYGGHYHLIGVTVSIALVGIVLWGTIMGSMLPFLLRKLGLDPASISAPLVATLVDVTGLIIYFTTAFIVLKGTLL